MNWTEWGNCISGWSKVYGRMIVLRTFIVCPSKLWMSWEWGWSLSLVNPNSWKWGEIKYPSTSCLNYRTYVVFMEGSPNSNF